MEGRDGLEQSGDQARCTLSVVRRPDESLKAVLTFARDGQCTNTLGGLGALTTRIRLRVRARDSYGPLLHTWKKKL